MNTYIKETLKNSIPDKIENAQPAQVHKHEIKVNVKEMREKIGCSRSEFSQRYGIARDTLKKVNSNYEPLKAQHLYCLN